MVEVKLSLDLASNGNTPVVDAMQNDSNSRVISANLYAGPTPWTVPEGCTVAVSYRKPDGTTGVYDTLPNSSPAVVVSKNNVRATLAAQVLTVSGDVSCAIVVTDTKTLNRVASFPITVRVATDPGAGKPVSNDYYKYSTMEEVSKIVEEAGSAIEKAPEAIANAEKAADRANTAADKAAQIADGKVDKSPIGAATPDDTQEVHLTPGGKLVTKPTGGGGGGSNIDDTVIATDSTWSSKKMVDTFYGYTPITKAGTSAVFASDVSYIDHDISCKIIGVADVTAATVKRYATNILPKKFYTVDSWFVFGQNSENDEETFLVKGCTYYFFYKFGTENAKDSKLYAARREGKGQFLGLLDNSGRITFTFSGETGYYKLNNWKSNYSAKYDDFVNWQLSYVDIPGQPYMEPQVFHPNADGTINGAISSFPSFAVVCDAPNANIEVTYHADLKKYIDNQSASITDAILSLGGNV